MIMSTNVICAYVQPSAGVQINDTPPVGLQEVQNVVLWLLADAAPAPRWAYVKVQTSRHTTTFLAHHLVRAPT
jgi:hypothetical protein